MIALEVLSVGNASAISDSRPASLSASRGQYGYYTDRETDLVLMGHRSYDPRTGRFLTRDPIGYGGGMNLYGYADGNPVN